MPHTRLSRIDPDPHRGCDIFGDPDHGSDEEKSESKIHRVVLLIRFEIYRTSSEREEYADNNDITQVPDIVMREEIDINCESNENSIEFSRILDKSELEYPLHTCDIAPDG